MNFIFDLFSSNINKDVIKSMIIIFNDDIVSCGKGDNDGDKILVKFIFVDSNAKSINKITAKTRTVTIIRRILIVILWRYES